MPAKPLAQTHVTIVGLGLMGGSLALALQGKCAGVSGVEVDADVRRLATRREVVRFVTGDFAEGVARAELLVLATPVRTMLQQLQQLATLPLSPPQPISLLDLGSTKTDITRSMAALPAHFDPVGGHPMCGKETAGFSHAEATLFANSTFVLTPLDRSTPTALTLTHELVQAIGARPLVLSPQQHDRLAALSSHVPYLAACGLVAAASEMAAEDPTVWALVASGFRDTTRLAGSDVSVMLDILYTNRARVRQALARQQAALDRLAALLEADEAALRAALEAIRTERLTRFPPGGQARA